MNELDRLINEFEKYLSNNLKTIFPSTQEFLHQIRNINSSLPEVKIANYDHLVRVDLTIPGLTKDHQLNINLVENQLVVHGKLRKEIEVKSDFEGTIKEYYSQYFYKTIPLPVKVSKNSVNAIYEDGMLKITLTKLVI